jgi:hypothetical protein
MNRVKAMALVPAFVLAASAAVAGPKVQDNFVSSTTTINGSSQTLDGTYTVDDPYLIQAWAFGGGTSCVRLDAVSPFSAFGAGNDLEIVMVAPNGAVWRNDDRAGGDARPLVKARTFEDGYHTVTVSHFAGEGATTTFRLLYGVYSISSPNCSGLTPSLGPDTDKEE